MPLHPNIEPNSTPPLLARRVFRTGRSERVESYPDTPTVSPASPHQNDVVALHDDFRLPAPASSPTSSRIAAIQAPGPTASILNLVNLRMQAQARRIPRSIRIALSPPLASEEDKDGKPGEAKRTNIKPGR